MHNQALVVDRARPTSPSLAGEAMRTLIAVCVASLARGDIEVWSVAPVASGSATGVTSRVLDDRTVRRDLWPCHSHATYEVCWVLQGRCILWLDGQVISLSANQACIIRPGQMHQLRPTRQLDPFHTLWWSATANGVLLFDSAFAGQRRVVSTCFTPLEVPAAPMLDVAARELQVRRPHHHLIVQAAMLDLAAHILRSLQELDADGPAATSPERRTSQYVHRVVQYLRTHHGADIKLDRLAAWVGLSPGYLTTLFHRELGRSVMAYVSEVRHREARSLLRNTDLSKTQVAELVGYIDTNYFSRVFKAREGYSPIQYRRLFRASNEGVPAHAESTTTPALLPAVTSAGLVAD
jgi:AraC-like DNA-binding protein/mannose-6-phosphate isomerase-like protein (cupin superfamily)